MRDMGVQIHIDDFGSGYSSLSCLKDFQVDGMKIDREFVKGLPTDADQASIVRAVVALAHGLSVNLVAEGVETSDQESFLDTACCDHVQGYLYAKAMPSDMAEEFIRGNVLVRDEPAAASSLSPPLPAASR
ncbi:MAG: EAL domain-containing protein [Planctomycetota bacterium]|nr:EAL domain-containing protein [Planctomycetota bacterium]